MTMRRINVVAGIAVALPLMTAGAANAADRGGAPGLVQLAQLSPAEIEAKKKAEQNKQKQAPPQGQGQRPPAPPQGRPPGPPEGVRRPPPERPVPKMVPPQQPRVVPPVQQKVAPPPPPPPPPAIKKVTPPPVQNAPPPVVPKKVVPPTSGQVPFVPPTGRQQSTPPQSSGAQQVPPIGAKTGTPFIPKSGPVGSGAPSGAGPAASAAQQPREGVRTKPGAVPFVPVPLAVKPQVATPAPNFKQLQQSRQTQVVGGRQTLIKEAGNRTIVKDGNVAFIRHDEAERFKRIQNARSMQLPGGIQQTFYTRPDGFRVITETDRNGRLLRRFRRGPDGREHAIIDNRRFWRNVGIGVGVGALVTIVALNLRPPVVTIPRERYIMDYERATDDDLYETLIAEPVERIERVYSLEEVRYNPELRDRVRRVDLDTITFDFGSFEIGPDQYGKLERLAKSINRVLADNPDSVFLIEGHTDAVGNAEDNLSLSDRRAQSVAQILTEQFGVPPENLTTQGYGEQFLKIPTQDAERANRRVAVRNITKLVSQDQ